MAPEILEGFIGNTRITYDSSIDLWALGCIFHFLLTGQYPFGDNYDQQQQLTKIKKHKSLDFVDKIERISDHSRNLLKATLQYYPKDRISWKQFFGHKVFQLRGSSIYKEGAESQFFGMMRMRSWAQCSELNRLKNVDFNHGKLQMLCDPEQMTTSIFDFNQTSLRRKFEKALI